jgi:hypothetical protein
MHSFKSSPLLPDGLAPRFARNTRRVSKRRVSKEQEPIIPNPFRENEQENYLPSDLRAQVEQLDYLSPTQIQTISFGGAGARRSSAFARHLQAMQNAAKKQEEMYHVFLGKPPKEAVEDCEMEEESPMTIEENDDVSLKMGHAFFRMDDEHEELNFFQQDLQEEDVIFYSQNMISDGEQEMQDDYEAYFDV